MSLDNGDPLTCEYCVHWKRQPVNPHNIREVLGECREGPPHTTTLPGANGQVMRVSSYPQLPPNFPACDRHKVALKIVQEAE
jgi:hypothetical protein